MKENNNGQALERAIHIFKETQTEQSLIILLLTLKESNVWVPCNAIPSIEDQKALEEMINNAADDLDSLKGLNLVTKGDMRLVPDILINGENYFFPVFTSVEAMGEYGSHFSKVQYQMLDILPLARNNEKNPVGIVINAFSESFVLHKDLYEVLENIEHRMK